MLRRLLLISVSVCVLLSLCASGVLSNSAGVGIPCDVANPILGSPNRQRDTNRAMWWTLPPQFAGTKYTLRTGDGPNVAMDLTSYTPDQYTEITIRANEQDRQFTGLLMYAENAAGKKLGEWIMPQRQPFHVDSVTGCVTHTNADPKNYKSVFRVKFPAGTGRVTIKALVKYGLAFPANEGAFYWPNSAHLVLNEGPATPQTWYQGQVGQSCNQVCAQKGLSCNLDVLRSAGTSSSLLSVASRVGSCFAPMMRACGSGSPTTGTQGCFYQDPTCTRASQQTTWVQADTCAGVPACASNTPYDKACCSYQGFKWCSKSYVNGPPEERQYGQWTKLGACAPAGGWPATPSFPNPAPRALAQADCTTVKTSAEDGARLCACGNGGPVVTDPPTPPTTQQPQPQATTPPPQPTTQQPSQTPRPSTTAPPTTRAPTPATTAPTAPPTPTLPPTTAPPTFRPPITAPPPTTPPPIINPGNSKFILRLSSGGIPSSCWNDGFATAVFSLGMALSANSGQSWEFVDGSAGGLPSVTVTFKQSITARLGGGWNTENSRTTGPNSWTFDMRQYQPSVGLILSWNAPVTCVNGRFSPEPSFSVTAVMPDGTPVLVDGTALVQTGYTSLSTLSTSTRVASPEEGPVSAYHGGAFGTLAVRNAVQSIQLDTSACWTSNSGLINAQLTFSIRQTDSSSPKVPHVPKTETGLPRITITFPELTSVDVTNVIQVDNSVSNDISWNFDEKTGQGVVGGVFRFAGDISCREGQITPPLVYTIAGQVNGVVFPTTSTSLGFAATAMNDLGSAPSSSSSSSASSSIAIIIGAAVAGAVVLIAVGAIVVYRRKRTTTKNTSTANRIQMDQTATNHIQMEQTVTNHNNNNTKITPANQHRMQWV